MADEPAEEKFFPSSWNAENGKLNRWYWKYEDTKANLMLVLAAIVVVLLIVVVIRDAVTS